MSFSSSEKDFSAVFRLVSTWRLHRKLIWIGILGKTFLGVFHRQTKVKNRTESCSHINFFPTQILVLISWMVSFIIFDDVCSVGSQRVVYMRENKPRTARVNGTKSMFTAYSTKTSSSRGLSWPSGFGVGLSKPRLTLDVKVFVVRGLLKPWTTAAHSLFSIISQTFTSERRALEWRENEFCLHLQIKVENGG